MPAAQTAPRRRIRVLWWAGGLAAAAVFGLWAPWAWWRAMECQAICSRDRAIGALRLETGATLPLLRKDFDGGTLWVEYVTQAGMRPRTALCSEARSALQALQAGHELGGAARVMLEPTDPRLRVLGWEWTGPVIACCVSTGISFKPSADGAWSSAAGGCTEYQGAAQQ
jgi:hypothetical protein